MKLYIDTEFNGFGGDLISMAIVSEDDHEWYEVLPMFSKPKPWVKENVMPQLNADRILMPGLFRADLHNFLRQFSKPTIIADWYADVVHFFEQFAGEDHSESINYPCTVQLIDSHAPKSEIPHNALSDARALRDWHMNLLMKENHG